MTDTAEKIPAPLRMAQRLGKRILGEQAVEKITAAKKVGALRLGPRVTGVKQEERAPATEHEPERDPSIPEIRASILVEPASLDRYIDAELHRHPPRKGALTLFLVTEEAKGDDARGEVIESLKAALETLV